MTYLRQELSRLDKRAALHAADSPRVSKSSESAHRKSHSCHKPRMMSDHNDASPR